MLGESQGLSSQAEEGDLEERKGEAKPRSDSQEEKYCHSPTRQAPALAPGSRYRTLTEKKPPAHEAPASSTPSRQGQSAANGGHDQMNADLARQRQRSRSKSKSRTRYAPESDLQSEEGDQKVEIADAPKLSKTTSILKRISKDPGTIEQPAHKSFADMTKEQVSMLNAMQSPAARATPSSKVSTPAGALRHRGAEPTPAGAEEHEEELEREMMTFQPRAPRQQPS